MTVKLLVTELDFFSVYCSGGLCTEAALRTTTMMMIMIRLAMMVFLLDATVIAEYTVVKAGLILQSFLISSKSPIKPWHECRKQHLDNENLPP